MVGADGVEEVGAGVDVVFGVTGGAKTAGIVGGMPNVVTLMGVAASDELRAASYAKTEKI